MKKNTLVYNPDRIFVLKKYSNHEVTKRVLDAYPKAEVVYVDNQNLRFGEGEIGSIVERGKKTLLLGETQNFISQQKGQKIQYCPGPRKILPITGCQFDCEYCFLQGTYRGRHPRIKFNLNIEKLLKQLDKDIEKRSGRRIQVYHMGENQDSLAFDGIFPLTTILVPFFAYKNARLMLLTKSDYVNNLLDLKHNRHTIASWSINSDFVTKNIEHNTAPLESRIDAAHKVQERGYLLRIRFDPLLIISSRDWKKDYEDMLNKVFKKLKPERITLGSFRFHPMIKTISNQRFGGEIFEGDKFVKKLDTDTRYRYKEETRIELYRFIIDGIRKRSGTEIALCKETKEVWKAVGLKLRKGKPKCHCYL